MASLTPRLGAITLRLAATGRNNAATAPPGASECGRDWRQGIFRYPSRCRVAAHPAPALSWLK